LVANFLQGVAEEDYNEPEDDGDQLATSDLCQTLLFKIESVE
jgi:hypothetical protein